MYNTWRYDHAFSDTCIGLAQMERSDSRCAFGETNFVQT